MRFFVRATLLALIGLSAVPAAAQEVAHSFADLRATVDPGTRVRLTDSNGVGVEGVLATITSSTITLTSKISGPMSFLESEVRTIHQRSGFRPWATTAGAIIGFGGGFIMALNGLGPEYTRDLPGYLAMTAGIGASFGISPDIRRMYRPIFASPGHSATVTISPIASAQRQGVMATIRFRRHHEPHLPDFAHCWPSGHHATSRVADRVESNSGRDLARLFRFDYSGPRTNQDDAHNDFRGRTDRRRS